MTLLLSFCSFFCLCGLLVDGWMGWCWWGRWWDGRHGGGSGVRPRMRLSGRGESRFVQSSLWSGLFLPLSEIWNFLTKLPNWGDSANMFRNIPIISLLILLILFVHPHCRQWWQCVLLKYFREEFFYREKLLKRGRKHWIDVGEGREVLPIKADGDGFAQEVRLHLFYYCTQKEMLKDAPASLEKKHRKMLFGQFLLSSNIGIDFHFSRGQAWMWNSAS